MPVPAFVVEASVVERWLVDGPWSDARQAFLGRCGALDARLLAPTCLSSEVSNALYHLCLTHPPLPTLRSDEASDPEADGRQRGHQYRLCRRFHRPHPSSWRRA